MRNQIAALCELLIMRRQIVCRLPCVLAITFVAATGLGGCNPRAEEEPTSTVHRSTADGHVSAPIARARDGVRMIEIGMTLDEFRASVGSQESLLFA